jgi:hypothetical protein
MTSTSTHLNEENILDILNKSDGCIISGSSDDTDDCEGDITVAEAAVNKQNSEVEEESQGHSLGDTYSNSSLYGRTQTIIIDNMNYFLVILGPNVFIIFQ